MMPNDMEISSMTDEEYLQNQRINESLRADIRKLQATVLNLATLASISLPPDKYPFLYQ